MTRAFRSWIWPAIATILPLVGLSTMILQAELATRAGPTLRVAIRGYDPRDLLHGHYLRYQFDFDWTEPDTCGPSAKVNATADNVPYRTTTTRLDPNCCLCLTRQSDSPFPNVRQVACGDPHEHCVGWLHTANVEPPLRYFIPETSAPRLEAAFAQHEAAVEIIVSPRGDLVVSELLLDGRPWREVLRD
ncbi:MAG: GDYXXLXY domain-containing protein [Polyangiaceae bacterium]